MLDPVIIEEIRRREEEQRRKKDEGFQIPLYDYEIDPSQIPNPDEAPPADEGYHEPGQKPARRREEPKKEETPGHEIAEIEIGTPTPDEEGDEIIPVPIEIINTDDIGVDKSIKINPDHPGNVTHGDVIEGRPRR